MISSNRMLTKNTMDSEEIKFDDSSNEENSQKTSIKSHRKIPFEEKSINFISNKKNCHSNPLDMRNHENYYPEYVEPFEKNMQLEQSNQNINSNPLEIQFFIDGTLERNDKNYHPEHFEPDALIVLGNTGSGKSTFINFLQRNPLQVILKNGTIVIYSDSNPKIGIKKDSETSFPFPYYVDELKMYGWDTPGYSDTSETKVEILNGVSIKAMLSRLKGKIKIVYVVEESKLGLSRGKEFIDEFEKFYNYIEDFSKIEDSLLLVFAKGGNINIDENGTANEITQILNTHKYLQNMKYKRIIEVLRKIIYDQRIFLFIKPQIGEDIYKKNNRIKLINQIKELKSINSAAMKVNQILSENAQNQLIQAQNKLKEEVEILENLLQGLHALPENLKNDFGNKLMIKLTKFPKAHQNLFKT